MEINAALSTLLKNKVKEINEKMKNKLMTNGEVEMHCMNPL